MSDSFPTFARCARFLRLTESPPAKWRGTPWWPADTLVTRQQGLLRVLSVAVVEQLELAPLVLSFAHEHRGRYRRRLLRLSQRLAAGTSLPDALEGTPGTLSDEHLLAIRFGIQSGTLAHVLRSLVERPNPESNLIRHRLRQLRCYAVLMGILLCLVLSLIVSKNFPNLQAILQDYSSNTTLSFNLLYFLTGTIVSLWPLLLLALLFCTWLIMAEFPARYFRRHVASRIFRPVEQLRAANLLNLLAIGAQAGHPLPKAISILAGCHYDSRAQQKLRMIQDAVAPGEDFWNRLAETRLLSAPESRALEKAASAGTTVWTLGQLAEWKHQHVARRFDLYVDLLLPAVIILLASIVLLTALATVTPVFEIIYELS